jgi:uncharacterized protein
MKINVAQLLKSAVGTSREYELDEAMPAIDDIKAVSNLTGKVRLTRVPQGILADADLRVTVELNCSRCLEELTYPLRLKFSEEYVPSVDIVTGSELPAPEDESTFVIDANHVLDLTEAVREYVLLAVPMKPLCKEACKGLCPTCGQNLNKGKCNCPQQPTDSRLAILAKLLEEEQEKGREEKPKKSE